MKKYILPEIKIQEINIDDVICVSKVEDILDIYPNVDETLE